MSEWHVPGPPAWMIGLIGLLIMGSFAAGVWLEDNLVPVDSVDALADAQDVLITLTRTPSVTVNEPTPWPTLTPTQTATPEPQVVYVEITTVVEIIITATPRPVTPTSVPTAIPGWVVATDTADLNAAKIARLKTDWMTFLLSPSFVITILVVMVTIFGVRISIKWSHGELEKSSQNETREDIEQRVHDQQDAGLQNILELLRTSEQLYGPGEKRLAGWREMYALNNQWVADFWSNVIREMEALGLRTIRQQGVGTYLAGNTIRTAKLYVLRLTVPPSPPAV